MNTFMTHRILFKVYTIWFLRRIVPLVLAQLVFLVFVLKALGDKIFFGRVISNARLAAHSSYWEFSKYLLGSFLQTHFAVQIFILVALGIGALLLRDLVRVLSSYART